MKSLAVALILAMPLGAFAIDECCNGWQYLRLPSPKKIDAAWDIYEEVEHKGGPATDSRSSFCVSKDDLMTKFPMQDGSGDYVDYLSRTQREHATEIFGLGTIGDIEINEVVHRFSEPIDYVKILTFTPPKSRLLCPFLQIAEWNSQLHYSKSTIVDRRGTKVIATSMLDEIAARHPVLVNVDFSLERGLPKRVRFELTDPPSAR